MHGFNIGDFDFGGEVGGFDGPSEGFGEDEAGYEEGGHEENWGEEDGNLQEDDEEQGGDGKAQHAEDGDAKEEGPAKKKRKITVRLTWSADMRRALYLMFPDDDDEDTDWYRWVPVLKYMFLVFRGLSFDEVVSKCRPLRREIINQDPSRFAKWAGILGQPGELARVQVDIINAERAIAEAPQGAASAAAAPSASGDQATAGTADGSAALASAGDDNLLYIPDARLPLDPPVTLSEMYDNYIEDPEVIWERNRVFLLAEAVSRWIDEHLNLAEAADYLQALLASEGTTSWSNEQLRAVLSFNNTRILDALLLVQHERAAFGVREHQWDVELAKAYSSKHPSLAPFAPAGDAFFRPFEMIHYVDVDFSIDPSHPRVYVTANQQPFFIVHNDPVFQRNGKVYSVLLIDQRRRSMRVDCQICDINFCKHCNPTRKLADCPLGFPFPFVHRDDVKGTVFHGNGPREPHMQAEGIADAKEVVYGDGAKRMTSVCRGGNCRRCG